jgi:MFS family permease
MSLGRLVYYSAIISGWAAFVGWLISETLILKGDANGASWIGVMLVGGIIGASIGVGLSLASGMSNSTIRALLGRTIVGILVGGIFGAFSSLLGNLFFQMGLPRALSFAVLGVGVGLSEGFYEGSLKRIRNGTIGGAIGGFVGGLLFDPLSIALQSGTGMASRATAFVILGICVGLMVGFVQVLLRDASLTVIDGSGVGRVLLVSKPVVTLGRSDVCDLPFIGSTNSGLAPVLCQIVRNSQGQFSIENQDAAAEISVKSEGGHFSAVNSTRSLQHGDIIRFGVNYVRFDLRKAAAPGVGASGGSDSAGGALQPFTKKSAAPPPPPKSKSQQSKSPPSQPPSKKAANPQPARGDAKSNQSKRTSSKSKLPPPPPPPPGKRK